MNGVRRFSRFQLALASALVALVAGVSVAFVFGVRLFEVGSPPTGEGPALQPGSDAAFAYLSAQHSNYCSLSADKVMAYDDDSRLRGACCSKMDIAKYRWQVDGLRHYSAIPQVPQDPYDIRVGLAKELLDYDTSVTLAAAEQQVYDAAMAMTHDKAPCCCQCWRWYMTEGLARFLIAEHRMGASEIASIVDRVNGCGGPMDEAASAAAGSRRALT